MCMTSYTIDVHLYGRLFTSTKEDYFPVQEANHCKANLYNLHWMCMTSYTMDVHLYER